MPQTLDRQLWLEVTPSGGRDEERRRWGDYDYEEDYDYDGSCWGIEICGVTDESGRKSARGLAHSKTLTRHN